MGLLSFFKRAEDNKAAAKPVAEGLDAVQQLRLRARRRLIGAAVLVAAGVIAFPLVFETQPRPVPVDLPIEIPKKDGLPPLSVPVPTAPAASAERQSVAAADQGAGIVNEVPPVVAPVAEPVKPAESRKPDTLAEPRKEAASKPEPKAEAKTESRKPAEKAAEKVAEKLQDKTPVKAAEKPAEKAQDKAHARLPADHAREADAARAQALLEGREPPKPVDKKPDAAAGGRFIVQVGAFAEARAAQDMRAKVEKLGLKTYTQAVETPDGKRIRVRVGPFASRDEADRAAAKLRGSGLGGTVLTL
ncbi:MAG TPA: SPOR domain-containing protein [Burkholderiaceae bacterium]|nr:SPOR domain-containing protein [Burkholderiaceae bacterium]